MRNKEKEEEEDQWNNQQKSQPQSGNEEGRILDTIIGKRENNDVTMRKGQ